MVSKSMVSFYKLTFPPQLWADICNVMTTADVEMLNFHMQCDAYDVNKRFAGEFVCAFDVKAFEREKVLRTQSHAVGETYVSRIAEFNGKWRVLRYSFAGKSLYYADELAWRHYDKQIIALDHVLRTFLNDSDVFFRTTAP